MRPAITFVLTWDGFRGPNTNLLWPNVFLTRFAGEKIIGQEFCGNMHHSERIIDQGIIDRAVEKLIG